ncbi:MAG TPA: MBL fold metallo-hydrolase, partial [Vicinamibacterales bacterium]|nr:MBL fold metallo-hydrolase [Vicinamibacterales bacterium]
MSIRVVAVAATVLASAIVSAQGDLDVLQIRPNVYMIAGAGANITVQFGSDGAVVVDAGSIDRADQVIAAIKKITPQPVRYVIDTSADADHVSANEKIAKAGKTLFQTNNPLGEGMTNGGAAAVLAAEKVLTRMSAPTGKASQYPTGAWPTETYDQRRKYMYLSGEGIEVLHQPAAHSDGDSVVFFRRSDVVAAGDVLDLTRFPVIDVAKGGSIQGEIDALNRLVDLAIPSVPLVSQEGGTYVVPGHGHICDQFDVVEYRDMVTIVRDRIQDLVKKGKTLEQV